MAQGPVNESGYKRVSAGNNFKLKCGLRDADGLIRWRSELDGADGTGLASVEILWKRKLSPDPE